MGTPRRRAQDGFRLRLSTSNLPGTLFLLILIVCATVLMLSKGLHSLKAAYAETSRTFPNPLTDSQGGLVNSERVAEPKTEDSDHLMIKKSHRATEHSSDYVLIPSKNEESKQSILN